jgi:hypothetical protein
MPQMLMTPLIKQEEAEYEMTITPDLQRIIREGMKAGEREQQLRFLTDEEGEVVLDDHNNPVPRPTLQLRNFAVSPDYHVQLPKDTAWFWNVKQVVDHILKTEVEQGLIVKDSRSKSTTNTERKTMGGKRVILRGGSGKKGGAPAKASKDKPSITRPSKSGGKKGNGKAPAGLPKGDDSGQSTMDVSAIANAIAEEVTGRVVEAVMKNVSEKFAEVESAIAEARQSGIEAASILHDVFVQVFNVVDEQVDGLSLPTFEECFDKDDKIFCYLSSEDDSGN